MDADPRISVALCTYNGARFVRQQLESIASQKLLPHELVVSDDASSDGSVAIVEAFARTAPFQVHVHRNDHTLGVSANFDRAMSLCAGEYIALADQDDVWLPHKLARLLEAILVTRASYAFSDASLIDESGRPLGGSSLLARRFTLDSIDAAFARRDELVLMLKRDFIYGTTLMLRASDLPFVQPISAMWSHDTWIVNMLAFRGRTGIPVLEPLVRYRQHAVQASGGTAAPKRVGYARRLAAYEDLRERLISADGVDARALSRLDEKLHFLRALVRMESAAPHRRAIIAVTELLSGRWWRYSPRTLLVDKRISPARLHR